MPSSLRLRTPDQYVLPQASAAIYIHRQSDSPPPPRHSQDPNSSPLASPGTHTRFLLPPLRQTAVSAGWPSPIRQHRMSTHHMHGVAQL